MAVPATKAELLAAIRTSHERLAADLATIPADRAGEATLEGHAKGTLMSVNDLVAYLIGWSELVLKWHRRTAESKSVDFPETGYGWNELGRLAQKFYADYADLTFERRVKRLAASTARMIQLVDQYDDAALYGALWYRKYTMGRMIQFNTSSPAANARTRIRKWKKANAIA